MIKLIYKLGAGLPVVRSLKASCMKGLLQVFKNKIADEEIVAACADTVARKIDMCSNGKNGERSKDLDEWRSPQGRTWEMESVCLSIKALELLNGVSSDLGSQQINSSMANSARDMHLPTAASTINNMPNHQHQQFNAAMSALMGAEAAAVSSPSSHVNMSSAARTKIRPAWTKYTPKVCAVWYMFCAQRKRFARRDAGVIGCS
jgi:hypothetical protein